MAGGRGRGEGWMADAGGQSKWGVFVLDVANQAESKGREGPAASHHSAWQGRAEQRGTTATKTRTARDQARGAAGGRQDKTRPSWPANGGRRNQHQARLE